MSSQRGNPSGGHPTDSPDKKRRAITKSNRPLHSAQGPPRQRSYDRLAYDTVPEIVIEVQHPGGTTSTYLVQPRNLSVGGLSLNHGGFIAPKTTCFVRLVTLDGKEVRVEGKVLGCRCVGGRLHDVGISFNEPIDLGQFVDVSAHGGHHSYDEPNHVELGPAYDKQRVIAISRELCGLATQDASLAELRIKLAEITALLSPSHAMDVTRE